MSGRFILRVTPVSILLIKKYLIIESKYLDMKTCQFCLSNKMRNSNKLTPEIAPSIAA